VVLACFIPTFDISSESCNKVDLSLRSCRAGYLTSYSCMWTNTLPLRSARRRTLFSPIRLYMRRLRANNNSKTVERHMRLSMEQSCMYAYALEIPTKCTASLSLDWTWMLFHRGADATMPVLPLWACCYYPNFSGFGTDADESGFFGIDGSAACLSKIDMGIASKP
jgi:hypothetical protein